MYLLINFLTISRIVLAVAIFILISFTSQYAFALILFVFAGISDFFDGHLARKYNLSSSLGEILDPVADKILVCFVFIGLAMNLSSFLIAFAAAFIISREIWVAALRDFNSRNDNISATKVSFLAKIKTSTQLFTISIYLTALAFNIMLLTVIGDIMIIVSVFITLYTGYQYTYQSIK